LVPTSGVGDARPTFRGQASPSMIAFSVALGRIAAAQSFGSG
jgi:hypothetical protein